MSSAAQVAFYFSFAIFPLLLFGLTLFGLILESADDLRGELFFYLGQIMPYSAYELVTDTIKEVTENSSGGKLTLGLFIALWSASAGVDSLRVALNSTYNLKDERAWWTNKLVSLVSTAFLTVLVFIALALVFYGWKLVMYAIDFANLPVPSPVWLIIIQWATILGTLILIFAFVYSFLPAHKPSKWTWVTPGALTAIGLWLALSYIFRIYLSYFNNYAKIYGSLGAVIILMLWLYLTALVILFGGYINSVLQEATDEELPPEMQKEVDKNYEEKEAKKAEKEQDESEKPPVKPELQPAQNQQLE
jgi:membrane protein